MISFLYPQAFLLLPVPALCWLLAPRWRDSNGLPVPQRLMATLSGVNSAPGSRQINSRQGIVLAGLGWLALIAALAVPITQHGPLLHANGRDLLLAVDASASMTEADARLDGLTMQRFDALKTLAGEFMRKREGDRIGLIAFAEQTYLIAPLTFDVAAAVAFLDEVEVGLPGKKTALGDAIGLATKTLKEQPDAARVLIMLSDGDSNAGQTAPVAAAQLARRHHIKVYAIGFGNNFREEAPTDQAKQSSTERSSLEQIAQLTGGKFFSARTADQLRSVYSELDQLEPAQTDNHPAFAERDWVRELLFFCLLILAVLTWRERQAARL